MRFDIAMPFPIFSLPKPGWGKKSAPLQFYHPGIILFRVTSVLGHKQSKRMISGFSLLTPRLQTMFKRKCAQALHQLSNIICSSLDLNQLVWNISCSLTFYKSTLVELNRHTDRASATSSLCSAGHLRRDL